jgi:hypothetical protein
MWIVQSSRSGSAMNTGTPRSFYLHAKVQIKERAKPGGRADFSLRFGYILLTPSQIMLGKSKSTATAGPGKPLNFWRQPAVIAPNNFKFKSLSNWVFNISVGRSRACRFCYVPATATNKPSPALEKFGLNDPDEPWDEDSLLRPWGETKFLASLKRAEITPEARPKPDGNRAVMFCITTDPYQSC